MWLKAATILAALALCALSPSVSLARVTVPPGSTEGDQYFEQVPNGGGSGSVDHGGGGTAGGGGLAPIAGAAALNKLGPDGQAAAALAEANRPPEQSHSNQGVDTSPSASTEGDGGMGAWFPILIVVTALAAIAYGVRRRINPA
jgi:hypothetical protein